MLKIHTTEIITAHLQLHKKNLKSWAKKHGPRIPHQEVPPNTFTPGWSILLSIVTFGFLGNNMNNYACLWGQIS